MKLIEFSFRNIFSYGNKLQTIKITPDEANLVLVHGKRGQGKSSLKEAIILSAYGKSPNRSLKNIPNRLNRNAFLSTKFISKSGDTIEIERGIAPTLMKLKINGEIPPSLPHKTKIDEYIENTLIGIPFNVFCNTITISVNDFKSFVSLAPIDKRKIIDRIFGIGEVNDMNAMNKLELQKVQQKAAALDMMITRNQELLISSTEQLELLKSEVKESNDAKIAEIKAKMAELLVECENIKAEKDATYKLYEPFSEIIRSYTLELQGINDIVTKHKHTITEIDKKIEVYNKNKCPHCLSDLTDNVHDTIKDKLILKKEDTLKEIESYRDTVIELRANIQNNTEVQKTYETKWRDLGNKLTQTQFMYSSLQSDLAKEEREDNTDLESSRLASIIRDIETKISDSQIERDSLNSDLLILSEMAKILADDGVKKLFMAKIIPMVNRKIIERSTEIEFPYSFEFDANFDPIIMHLGQIIELESLSTGEQKEMNLITLFCILDLIVMKMNLNFLFLDEVFTSLDTESIYKLVKMLRSFTDKHKITVFAISHDPLPSELFDNEILIKKEQHFSDIFPKK